ncbi:MAG: beta-ketoacyl synthase N-terminal-like domain-containing protein [Pseudomonadota bacterium]
MAPITNYASNVDVDYATLTEAIQDRRDDSEKGITIITDNNDSFVSFRQLYGDALKVLHILQKKGISPKCEILFQLDDDPKSFLTMFWACILGGIIPVPIAIKNNHEHIMKIFYIWDILRDKYLVASEDIIIKLKVFADENSITNLIEEANARTINYSELCFDADTPDGLIYETKPPETAYIQFSSGTTGAPKGVILSHENLMTNIKGIISDSQFCEGESMLSWMPLTHDMGLIGFHLVPLVGRMNHYLIPPIFFILEPLSWLSKVSQYKANIISGPNFAYQHVLKYFKPELAKGLDLSSVRLIFNGAEPISPTLCMKFLNVFGEYGLKAEAMYPVYGLAEASLAVTFPSLDQTFVHFALDRESIVPGHPATEVDESHPRAVSFVEVGHPVTGTEIRIIDSYGVPLTSNEVGEIQIRGKNVTKGYYGNSEATKRLISDDGWVNTGDLAFLRNGKLVIVGRTKDILFINGQNYYSHDLERVLETGEPKLVGQIVVVGIPDEFSMRDQVVVFVKQKELKQDTFKEIVFSLKRILRLKTGIEIHHVIPVKRIPKTTSGKAQRSKLKRKFQKGEFSDLIKLFATDTGKDHAVLTADTKELQKETTDNLIRRIQEHLIQEASELLSLNEEEIDPDSDMSGYGFTSLTYVKFCDTLGGTFNIEITPSVFFSLDPPTLAGLSTFLYGRFGDAMIKFFRKASVVPGTGRTTVSTKEGLEAKGREVSSGIVSPGEQGDSGKAIAVIGMNGFMPGAKNLDQFWLALKNGENLVSEIPADRWDHDAWLASKPSSGKQSPGARWGGFMSQVDKFDPLFFGISPREAELMDPQQRLFLEVAWKTLEDAGYKASALSGSCTGVFVGIASSDYLDKVKATDNFSQPHSVTGVAHSIAANRISYLLNLRGPSESIDTACSSSLVALHRAVKAIQNKECEMAIAGGVNVIIDPSLNIAFDAAGMLSPDGRCKTFDNGADGYVRGEGVGAVLLKPFKAAERDKDHIYAVIKGTAVNHGGRSNSLTAPNENAQAELLVKVYREAGISPDTVTYVEAHGTGTKLGDPVEVNGLKRAFDILYDEFGKDRAKEAYCGIGSVKTNIGHLETAAGIARLIKVLLSMQNKTLPAHLNFNQLNPYITLKHTPFFIVDKTCAWDCLKDKNNLPIPRRAGVSSFGFGGVNAHVVLEEYRLEAPEKKPSSSSHIIILSAKSTDRLRVYAQLMADYIENRLGEQRNAFSIEDIAYTLQIGREEMEERLAIITDKVEGLVEKLRKYAEGRRLGDDTYCHRFDNNSTNMGFLNDDEDIAHIITNWIQKKKYVKIAQLWLSGVHVNWPLLHTGADCKRLPLPTYPFARERFWLDFPIAPHGAHIEPGQGGFGSLHPLIDTNESTLDEQKYRKRFTGPGAFFKDHIVGNSMILPGAVHLEMARVAGNLALKNASNAEHIVMRSPFLTGPAKLSCWYLFTPHNSAIL